MMSQQKRPIDRIAPDGFTESYPGDSIDECLNYAHRQAETVTPVSELPKCPSCESQRVQSKPSDDTMASPRDYDTSFVCTTCRNHFDTPVYDLEERDADPFDWVDPDDLAEPPITRQLAELDDRALTALAIWLYRPWAYADDDPSYRELSTIFPYSRVWIGDRIRAWKDGEHRDLVRDPRPRVRIGGDADD